MHPPTRILPVGIVGDYLGHPINVADYSLRLAKPEIDPLVVLVFGTAMNSGKTMTAGSLVHGFASRGLRAAGIKATGTGSGGDLWFMRDLGASVVADFTDVGLPSTYLAPPERIEDGVFQLIDHAGSNKCKVAVVEIADGLQHAETRALLQSSRLRERVYGVVFAAYDSLGAEAGVRTLRSNKHNILGLSGQLARSPLAIREAGHATGIQVFSPLELQAGLLADQIISRNEWLSDRTAAGVSRKRFATQRVPAIIDINGANNLIEIRHFDQIRT